MDVHWVEGELLAGQSAGGMGMLVGRECRLEGEVLVGRRGAGWREGLGCRAVVWM